MAQLFGQEINLDLDPKVFKSLIFAASGIACIAFLIAYPIPKAITLKKEKENYEAKLLEKEKVESKKINEQKKLDRMEEILKEQEARLENLRDKFGQSGLKDETYLKVAIQVMINYLQLELVEQGSMQVAEETEGYTKIYIPYTVKGEYYKVARLLYYLENSRWLLTLRGSDLEINSVEETVKYKDSTGTKEIVQSKFKIGGYLIKESGEVWKDDGLEKEKKINSIDGYLDPDNLKEGNRKFTKSKRIFKKKVYDTSKMKAERAKTEARIKATFIKVVFVTQRNRDWAVTFYYKDEFGTQQRKTIDGSEGMKIGKYTYKVTGIENGLQIIDSKTKVKATIEKKGR